MLPTPAKFHYVFNLRDLSRIWEGMLNVTSEVLNSDNILFSLWKHECIRVIADRFTNFEDKEWFDSTIARVIGEELGEEFVANLPEEPYFVDFLRLPWHFILQTCLLTLTIGSLQRPPEKKLMMRS